MRPGCELNRGMWPKGTVGGCVMLSCQFCNLPFWKREAPTLVCPRKEGGWRLGCLKLKEKRAGGLDSGPEPEADSSGSLPGAYPEGNQRWRITILPVCGEQDVSTSSSDKGSQTALP